MLVSLDAAILYLRSHPADMAAVDAVARLMAEESGVDFGDALHVLQDERVQWAAYAAAFNETIRDHVRACTLRSRSVDLSRASVIVVYGEDVPSHYQTAWEGRFKINVSNHLIGKGVPSPGTDVARVCGNDCIRVGCMWVIRQMRDGAAPKRVYDEILAELKRQSGKVVPDGNPK